MTLFLLAVAVVFLATGTCALVEAALYAVPRPYVRQLAESGQRSGVLLSKFKDRMDYPISAILIFDTILGVGGAAIAGSQARVLFGPEFVIWFSIGLSASLLIISQIIPKILGVAYSKLVARGSAIPISVAIKTLFPVVWVIEKFTRHLKPDEPLRRASEEEVRQMAQISAEEGSIMGIEADLIQNSLRLNDVSAAQIMTPLENVCLLPADMLVKDAFATFDERALSRIPVHSPGNRDLWTGLVMSRDIFREMAQDREDVRLSSLTKRLYLVSSDTRGHVLLDAFLKRRSHLFGVQDRRGKMIGVVTLEDVIEEILGKEIIDEREISTPEL
jgi:CBS domain containing-hemolysin-like protein